MSCHEHGTNKNFWVSMRNWTSDLHILHSDVLPLSHRDSTLVEAYYSSLRTSHDCFISDVNISTIASFNRMKQITNDLNLVVKAMKTSSMLEVGFTNCFKKYCRLALLKVFFNVICGRYKMNWGQTKGKYLLKGLLISLEKNSCWNWGFFLLYIFNGF